MGLHSADVFGVCVCSADVFVHEQSELLCIVVQHVAVWASCEQLGLVTSNYTVCKAASHHHCIGESKREVEGG